MAQWLKQSTAATVPIGPFVDDTDFKTAETALTISQADIRLSKNGGTFAQTNNATGASHLENGVYGVPLDTTDTNTLGRLRVEVHESGALAVWQDFMVVPANVWDSMFSTDLLQVDAREWLGGTIATPTVTGVPEVDVTHFNGTAGTFASGRPEVNTSHIAGSAVSTTTAQIGVNVVQLSADSVAADNAEAFFDGTGYAGTNNVIPTVTTVNGLAANTVTASALAADAVAEIADGVWDEAAAGHVGAGTFGEQCGTDIDAILVDTGTTLQAEVDGIQADTEDIQTRLPAALVSGRIDASVGAYQTGLTPLQPTVAGRTLDVSVGGEAGLDWANVGSPTTAVDILNTRIGQADAVLNVSGNVAGNVGGNVVGNVEGSVLGSVASVAAGGITAASIATGAIDADALAADAVDEIWDEVMEGAITARQSIRLANSANGAKLSGAATTNVLIRDLGDTKNRVNATVDADGNRSAVTLDLA